MKKLTVAYAIGRWSPPHLGHIRMFLWLSHNYDRLIIGIASCYTVGTSRYPLLAYIREKMIRLSLVIAGVDINKVKFVHLYDFKDENIKNGWDLWWKHITSIPDIEYVTHFVTGNEDEIIGEIKKKGLRLNFKLVNPEKEMPPKYHFAYHATDLRNAIADGNYELFYNLAAPGTIALMGQIGGFAGMRSALGNNGVKFIPGRQAVDVIVTLGNLKEGIKVLCGVRKCECWSFPGWLALPGGGIEDYENPLFAIVRELIEETNLHVKIVNANVEPAHIMVDGNINEIKFIGIYGTEDIELSGDKGGSSQAFHIHLDKKIDEAKLNGLSDLEDVCFRDVKDVLEAPGLAFQQDDMLRDALAMHFKSDYVRIFS